MPVVPVVDPTSASASVVACCAAVVAVVVLMPALVLWIACPRLFVGALTVVTVPFDATLVPVIWSLS